MNDIIISKILDETCSNALVKAITENKYIVSDFDLLYLTFNYAANFYNKLNLLNLIAINTSHDRVKKLAIKAQSYLNNSLESFAAQENECVYEVKIKIYPSSYEESYIVKQYNNIANTVKNFCKCYAENLNEQTNIIVHKFKMTDNLNSEDLDNYCLGLAKFQGDISLIDVDYFKLSNCNCIFKDDKCKSIDCDDCIESLSCCIPQFPRFINNLDLVCYVNNDNEKLYGIYLENSIKEPLDDCAYVVEVNEKLFGNKQINTTKKFDKCIYDLHDHIALPRLEIADFKYVPKKIKKIYNKFVALFNKYNAGNQTF